MIPIQIVLLLGVLLAAVISFAIMGLAQTGRSRKLARLAHESALRFSREDPFEVYRQFEQFAPIHAGHSPVTNNVTFGRLDSLPIRAFDFRCEIAHGTSRTTRRYSIIAVQSESQLPTVTMWNDTDAGLVPLDAMSARAHLQKWSASGDPRVLELLAHRCQGLGDEGLSLQTSGNWLMMYLPMRRGRSYMPHLHTAVALAQALAAQTPAKETPAQPCPPPTSARGDN